MTQEMPVALLAFAGLLGLVFAWPRLSKPTSQTRLFVDVLIIAVGTAAASVVAWAVYRWIEQRWWTRRVPEPTARSLPGISPARWRMPASIRR
jgi:peptidoglycan biosynthesis protein MviN/MurJ (putative lipid II flippase)